jgi:hypothetical protein
LRNVHYDPITLKRPGYFGHLTNNIVYYRMAPYVWKELKSRAAKETRVAKPHLHRFLTQDLGDPRLREVITTNITAMKLSDDWFGFLRNLDRVLPPYNQTLQLPFVNGSNEAIDDGIGL